MARSRTVRPESDVRAGATFWRIMKSVSSGE